MRGECLEYPPWGSTVDELLVRDVNSVGAKPPRRRRPMTEAGSFVRRP